MRKNAALDVDDQFLQPEDLERMLADAWMSDDDGMPYILQLKHPSRDAFVVTVVWDRWAHLDSVLRDSIAMRSLQRLDDERRHLAVLESDEMRTEETILSADQRLRLESLRELPWAEQTFAFHGLIPSEAIAQDIDRRFKLDLGRESA